MDGIYSEKQLRFLAKNFDKTHNKMEEIFRVIGKHEGLVLHRINKEVGVSDFVRDKCITALQLAGLIEKKEVGTAKQYSLTEEGMRLKELLEREN